MKGRSSSLTNTMQAYQGKYMRIVWWILCIPPGYALPSIPTPCHYTLRETRGLRGVNARMSIVHGRLWHKTSRATAWRSCWHGSSYMIQRRASGPCKSCEWSNETHGIATLSIYARYWLVAPVRLSAVRVRVRVCARLVLVSPPLPFASIDCSTHTRV